MKRFVTILILLPVFIFAQEYMLFNTDNSDLPANAVYSIDTDQNGNIWFGGQKSAATGVANVSRLSSDLSTWKVFTDAELSLDGLEDRVFYIAEDQYGTMWFCTHYGVSWLKTDGTSGKVDFTVDNYTRTVQTDKNGTVYISDRTPATISVSSDGGDSWDTWDATTLGMPEGDRPEIYDLATDSNGRLWLCTWYGVYYRDSDGTFGAVEDAQGAWTYAMTMDPTTGHVWVTNWSDSTLWEIMADGSYNVYDSEDAAILGDNINDLEADGDGVLWLATSASGLVKLNKDLTYVVYDSASTEGMIPQNNLTHMEIFDGVIWASTESEGIVRISGLAASPASENITLFSTDNSDLPANAVYSIDTDQNGNIWFGGQKSAATGVANVSRLSSDLSTWKVFTDAELSLDGLEDRVFYIAEDQYGTMWFCTHYGVSWLKTDGTSGKVDFTVDNYTRTVQTDKNGTVYISDRTPATISVSSDGGDSWDTWDATTLGMPEGDRPEIYDLATDSNGRLWLCTWYGVYYRDSDGTFGAVEDAQGAWTYAMTMDPTTGHLWVTNWSDSTLWEIMADGSYNVFDSEDAAVLGDNINDLEADGDGVLWLATSASGLVKLNKDLTYVVYDSASTEGMIPQNNLTHMEIFDGVIWASTESEGILRLEGYATPVVTSIADKEAQPAIITTHELYNNYPNPFNPTTNIAFNLANPSNVSIKIFNITGKLVKNLVKGFFNVGKHELQWDGTDFTGSKVASGVYYYTFEADNTIINKKMLLVK